MGTEKIIVAVGTSEEVTAHLRLLLRQASGQLNHKWVWGPEVSADLVVVDPDVFAGQMARARAQSSGVRCAVVSDGDEAPADALWLRRPLRLPNVVDVMNEAGQLSIKSSGVDAHGVDFYFKDLGDFKSHGGSEHVAPDPWEGRRQGSSPPPAYGEHAPPSQPQEPPPLQPHPQYQQHHHGGLDEMIKGDPLKDQGPKKILPSLGDDVTIEKTEGPTSRSEKRSDAHISLMSGSGDAGGSLLPSGRARPLNDTDRQPIGAYLRENLLGGPAVVKFDDAPALVLDPKNEVFHCEESLSACEPYCREPLSRTAWRRLTSAELAQVTAKTPGRPYAHLRWLETLLQSNGRLSGKLDPGGTYRLKDRIEVAADYHDHGAIADAMVEPARLNEITAASRTTMERVFDIVNAYDAIGLVEWQPRARLRGDDPGPKPKGGGFLGKLKSVFGSK